MKRNLLAATVALSIVTLMGCNQDKEAETANAVQQTSSIDSTEPTSTATPAQDVELESTMQQASYGIGLSMGKSLSQDGLSDLDVGAFTLGMQDALSGEPARISEQDLMTVFQQLQSELEERADMQDQANQQAGTDFLTENGLRDGVVTTESGLQYEIIESGDAEGAQPAATDVVTVHYEGKLVEGTVFDSSLARGEPIDFPVGQVIPGWVEALQLMRVGDKWQLTIPSELGYGEVSPSPLIPPNSVLTFEVELLGIKDTE